MFQLLYNQLSLFALVSGPDGGVFHDDSWCFSWMVEALETHWGPHMVFWCSKVLSQAYLLGVSRWRSDWLFVCVCVCVSLYVDINWLNIKPSLRSKEPVVDVDSFFGAWGLVPPYRCGCCGARLDPNTCQLECQKGFQIECQNICQTECQKESQTECEKKMLERSRKSVRIDAR